jgi:hypothetical protein
MQKYAYSEGFGMFFETFEKSKSMKHVYFRGATRHQTLHFSIQIEASH